MSGAGAGGSDGGLADRGDGASSDGNTDAGTDGGPAADASAGAGGAGGVAMDGGRKRQRGGEGERRRRGVDAGRGDRRRRPEEDERDERRRQEHERRQLVEDCAVLAFPGDADGLADGVRAILAEPGTANAMRTRGRELAAKWPDEDGAAKNLLDIYAASEQAITGVSAKALLEKLQAYGHRSAHYLGSMDESLEAIATAAGPGAIR